MLCVQERNLMDKWEVTVMHDDSNDNRVKLATLCHTIKLVTGGTISPQKNIHEYTQIPQDSKIRIRLITYI